MTSAEGPSRAGPISDRVVKPDALDTAKLGKMVEKREDVPSTKTCNIGSRGRHRKKCQFIGFRGHSCNVWWIFAERASSGGCKIEKLCDKR